MYQFPYQPGHTTVRGFEGYDAYQEKLWQAVDDIYRAMTQGYSHTRLPTPGKSFDEKTFQLWRQKAITAWTVEATRDNKTRGISEADMPQSSWLYLYERIREARNAPKTPPPYLDD